MPEAINKQNLRIDRLSQAKQYEGQFPYQVGDDDSHLALYPEIVPLELEDNYEAWSDTLSYWVSSTGNDSTGSGTESSPWRTVDKAITEFFNQSSRVKKYIVLKDDYIYVEDINIPKWLEGYIYRNTYAAYTEGTSDMSSGYDWSSTNQNFLINVALSNYTVNLTQNCTTLQEVIDHINYAFENDSTFPGDLSTIYEAYDAGSNYVGIRRKEVGSPTNFSMSAGSPDALTTLGITAGTYSNGNLGSATIRRIERTIPSGLNDTNTKWVDVNSGNDSTGSGTRAAPYKTVNKALSDITTTAFTSVAVLIDDSNYQSEEVINWMPSSTPTQTVKVFPYMNESPGSSNEEKAGKTLEILFDTTQGINTKGTFANKIRYDAIISRNFNSNKEEEIIFVNYNTNTSAIQKTSDFKTINSINSTSSRNWGTITEQFYDGHWYLLIAAYDNSSGVIRVFYYKDDGTTGEWTKTDPVYSDIIFYVRFETYNGLENVLCVTSQDSHTYFYKLDSSTSPTSSSCLQSIGYVDHSISMYQNFGMLDDDEYVFYYTDDLNRKSFYIITPSNNTIKEYTFTQSVNTKCIFKYKNNYYIHINTSGYKDEIYQILLEDRELLKVCDLATTEDLAGWFKYYGSIYLFGDNYLYHFDGSTATVIGDTSSDSSINSTTSVYFRVKYQNKIFKGMVIRSDYTANTNIEYINISNIVSFGKLDLQGTKIENSDKVTAFTGDEIKSSYCRFTDNIVGIYSKENSLGDISNCIFDDCDYPVIIEQYCGDDIDKSLFYNFIDAITYDCRSDAGTSNIDIDRCTGYLGEKFLNVSYRNVTTGNESNIIDTIISGVGYNVYSLETINVDISYSMLYPYAANVGVNIDTSNCNTNIPFFSDIDSLDFRLKCKALAFGKNSLGKGLSSQSYSATGNDYNWDNYSSENGDIGAFTLVDPIYRNEVYSGLDIEIAPNTANLNIIQHNASLTISKTGLTNKTSSIKKRKFSFNYGDNIQTNLKDNIGNFELILVENNPMKLFTCPLFTYQEVLTHNSLADFQSSFIYDALYNGKTGWASGSWDIENMVVDTGLSIKEDFYNKLFLTIYKEPSSYPGEITKYEYKIEKTNNDGTLELNDFFEIGDMADGTYLMCIQYAMVLHDESGYNYNQPTGLQGFNYNDFGLTTNLLLNLTEAV